MKIYFLSSQPCALSINQVFFGVTDRFERFADVVLSDNVFIQFAPQNALPISFFLTENIRFTAPDGVEVYFVKDGLVLYAKDFPPSDCVLKPITQARENDLLVTVFRQGHIQVSIQTPESFFTATLPPVFDDCKIEFHQGLIFIVAPTCLHIFNSQGTRIFAEDVLGFSVENDILSVTLPLSDSLGRVAHCQYALSATDCVRTGFSLSQARAHNGALDESAIQTELLAFAFFETVLIGGDYSAFLSEALQPKAESLRAFLGEFCAVTPTDNPLVCGLVKRIGERIFETAYFSVEISDGKICEIKG